MVGAILYKNSTAKTTAPPIASAYIPFSKATFTRTDVLDNGNCLFDAIKLCLQTQIPEKITADISLRAVFVKCLIDQKRDTFIQFLFKYEAEEYVDLMIRELKGYKINIPLLESVMDRRLSSEELVIKKREIDSPTNPIAHALLAQFPILFDIPNIQDFLDSRIANWERIHQNLQEDLNPDIFGNLLTSYIQEIQNPQEKAGRLALHLLANHYKIQIHLHATRDPDEYPESPIESFGPENGPEIHLIYDNTRAHYQALLPNNSPQTRLEPSFSRLSTNRRL